LKIRDLQSIYRSLWVNFFRSIQTSPLQEEVKLFLNKKELSPIIERILLLFLLFLSLQTVSPAQQSSAQPSSKTLIRRDTYGVPHILAQSEPEAAYAYGFAAAEDHGVLMARLFLRGRGEQSLVFGEKTLVEDFKNQELMIYQTARERFLTLPPLIQSIFNNYARGYNLYLSQNRQKMPEWATEINGIDVLAYCRTVLLLDFSLDKRYLELLAAPPGTGSNAWGIGKGRSASGRGILLANPHLGWEGSGLLHEVHICVPGKINVSGAALIGFPFVVMGFNQHLGWTHTVNFIDSDDLYELTLDPVNPRQYVYEGMNLPIEAKTLTVRVKTPEGIQTRTKIVYRSHYGPIIKIEGNKAFAVKSANLDAVDFATQWIMMAKAGGLTEFQAALHLQALPMFNITYADREGNILYLFNGRIPSRPPGYKWDDIVPGNSSQSEWYTVHPLSELPQIINPPSGYVQNCNDAPWYSDARGSLKRAGFPDYMSEDGIGLRGQRSLQLLELKNKISLDDVKAHIFDDHLLLADRVKMDLIALVRDEKADNADLAQAAEILVKWDNQASINSTGATLFELWWDDYSKGNKKAFKLTWQKDNPLTTPAGIGDRQRAIESFAKIVKSMKEQYGTIEVPWGEIHRVRRGTLDIPGSGAIGKFGAFHTIGYRLDKDGKKIANFGDTYVLAVEFSDLPTAFSIMTYSQSSNPQSKHYADQTALFGQARMKPVWFGEKDIQANLERTYSPGQSDTNLINLPGKQASEK
jgi:acyl-homoserine-lactone acylase